MLLVYAAWLSHSFLLPDVSRFVCFVSHSWSASSVFRALLVRHVQLSQDLFHSSDLVTEIIGVSLPLLFLCNPLALVQIPQCCHNHRSVLWRGYELVTGAVVFRKTHVLSIGALVRLRMMKTVPPWQRKSSQVRNHPIQFALIPLFQLLLENFKRYSPCGLSREHQGLKLVFEGLILNFGIAQGHFWTLVV